MEDFLFNEFDTLTPAAWKQKIQVDLKGADYNDSLIKEHYVTRGSFSWKDGIKDTQVIFSPNNKGRFLISWTPNKLLQNKKYTKKGVFYES